MASKLPLRLVRIEFPVLAALEKPQDPRELQIRPQREVAARRERENVAPPVCTHISISGWAAVKGQGTVWVPEEGPEAGELGVEDLGAAPEDGPTLGCRDDADVAQAPTQALHARLHPRTLPFLLTSRRANLEGLRAGGVEGEAVEVVRTVGGL